MFRSRTVVGLIAVCAVVLWFSISDPPAQTTGQVRAVHVTNFPSPQEVKGSVKVEDPIQLAELVAFRDVIVPPVEPTETLRMVDGGVLTAAGFPNVVLSLQGNVKGDVKQPGEVGAILLPEEEPIRRAFDEFGIVQFPMEVVAPHVSRETPYFSSTQPRYTVGFERYRIFFYNRTDKSVTVNLFAYLTN